MSVRDGPYGSHDGTAMSFDGTSTLPFSEKDVAEWVYEWETGDRWDGTCAAVVLLRDGRLAAWESWWGPTGSGFFDDAYGGDAEVWFAREENLRGLIMQALSDESRRGCGIPAEGSVF
jgi:hypothetical protein